MRVLLSLLLASLSLPLFAAPRLNKLTLPTGFHIAVYSDRVPNAREIALGAHGTVFVGSSGAGKVYALTDSNGDGVADKVRTIVSGLRNPIGVAFHDGDLYVSIGAPCNICDPGPDYAKLIRMNADGSVLVSDDLAGAVYRVAYKP